MQFAKFYCNKRSKCMKQSFYGEMVLGIVVQDNL